MVKEVAICSVSYCEKPARVLGMCQTHYATFRRNGDPTILVQKQHHGLSVKERFALYARQCDGCWEWTGQRDPRGYGRMHVDGRPMLAHRVAYLVTYGSIPPGMAVLHKCDTPKCVNPEHLFLGTQADNVRDMHNKGRALKRGMKGSEHPMSKLTEQDVRAIRKAEGFARDIAAVYGISPTQVYDIRHRRSWAHITDA